jgi:hypothetical protein
MDEVKAERRAKRSAAAQEALDGVITGLSYAKGRTQRKAPGPVIEKAKKEVVRRGAASKPKNPMGLGGSTAGGKRARQEEEEEGEKSKGGFGGGAVEVSGAAADKLKRCVAALSAMRHESQLCEADAKQNPDPRPTSGRLCPFICGKAERVKPSRSRKEILLDESRQH